MGKIILSLIVCFLVVSSIVFADEASGVTHSGDDIIGGDIKNINSKSVKLAIIR